MNNKKRVLYVEDDETLRSSLVMALKLRGFDAEGAANVAATRRLIKQSGREIDVIALDMRLEDAEFPNLTGADLGLEARETIGKRPPEFLILSGYRHSDYYAAALKLDTAAYLGKSRVEQEDVIRHIRSLALRRALSFEREEVNEKISAIAESSPSPAEAIAGFCRDLLSPEMQACIGAPSIFLLTDEKGTQNCCGNTDLPPGYHEAYAKIQALIQGAANTSDAFVIDWHQFGESSDEQTCNIYKALNGAAFLPLFVIQGLRLSIGILKSDDPQQKLPEDPAKLTLILIPYLRSVIIELLFWTLSRLREIKARREIEILLQHTSRFCRWVGQEQLAILEEALGKNDINSIKECFQKFKALSEDLRLTGEFLSPLALNTTNNGNEITPQAAETIRDVWREITEQFDVEGIEFEGPDGDFSLPVARADLFLSTLRVLQWMALRKDRIPIGSQKISVEYANGGDSAQIIFTDQSRRLGKNLRGMLFEPFTQANLVPPPPKDKDEASHPGLYMPLFLAKMLVEVKYKGSLRDRTDDLETPNGHRFVMSFPLNYQR